MGHLVRKQTLHLIHYSVTFLSFGEVMIYQYKMEDVNICSNCEVP